MWQMGLESCPVSVRHQMVSDWSISCSWEQSPMVTHFGKQLFHNGVFCWSTKFFGVLESQCWMLAFELCQFCWSSDCCDNKDQQWVETSAVVVGVSREEWRGPSKKFTRRRRRCREQANIELQATGASVEVLTREVHWAMQKWCECWRITRSKQSVNCWMQSDKREAQSTVGRRRSMSTRRLLQEQCHDRTVDQHTWTVQCHKNKRVSTQKTGGTAGQNDWMCTFGTVKSNWRSVWVSKRTARGWSLPAMPLLTKLLSWAVQQDQSLTKGPMVGKCQTKKLKWVTWSTSSMPKTRLTCICAIADFASVEHGREMRMLVKKSNEKISTSQLPPRAATDMTGEMTICHKDLTGCTELKANVFVDQWSFDRVLLKWRTSWWTTLWSKPSVGWQRSCNWVIEDAERNGFLDWTLQNVLRHLTATNHGPTELVPHCNKRILAAAEVIEAHWGHFCLVKLTTGVGSVGKQTAGDNMLSMILLAGADKKRIGVVFEELNGSHLAKKDSRPASVEDAVVLLSHCQVHQAGVCNVTCDNHRVLWCLANTFWCARNIFDQIWTNQNKDKLLRDETKSCAKHFCVPIMCHAEEMNNADPCDPCLWSKTQKVWPHLQKLIRHHRTCQCAQTIGLHTMQCSNKSFDARTSQKSSECKNAALSFC